LNRRLKKSKENVSPEVRRQLLFGEAVLCDMKQSLSTIRSSKTKQVITDNITFTNLKKYRFVNAIKPFFSYASFRNSQQSDSSEEYKKMMMVKECFRAFYKNDDVSSKENQKAETFPQ